MRNLLLYSTVSYHRFFMYSVYIPVIHDMEGILAFSFVFFRNHTVEFFHNYQNTNLTDQAITSYLVFPILNLLQSLINLVVLQFNLLINNMHEKN